MKKIQIAIADDQVLFLRAMVSLLNSYDDIEVVMQARDGKDLLSQLEKNEGPPDILLLDLRMPSLDGMQACKVIREKYPQLKIIALSALEEERFISYMIEQGVRGYLLKNSEPEEVYKTISEVFRSGQYFSPLVINVMHRRLIQPGKKESLTDHGIVLTKREKEILDLICKECTMKEIAQKLSLSLRTIEGHRNNLLSKTGSKNTAGLVGFAIQHQLYKRKE
jgi:DNA-binding NarL/FixJ family response regulator